jgi:hypothetical protein
VACRNLVSKNLVFSLMTVKPPIDVALPHPLNATSSPKSSYPFSHELAASA